MTTQQKAPWVVHTPDEVYSLRMRSFSEGFAVGAFVATAVLAIVLSFGSLL